MNDVEAMTHHREVSLERHGRALDTPIALRPSRTSPRPRQGLDGAVEGILPRLAGVYGRLSDQAFALAVSGVLFTLTAWPLLLTDVPPLQDLPNHLATVEVIRHPELYPELVSNGFFKTNAALFSWLVFVGKFTGTVPAARLFAAMVLALNSLVLPQFVLRFGGRARLLVASFFMWPMVHNWFVSMGMLDFALGVPLSLSVLLLLDRQRTRPTLQNGLCILGLSLATWYAHVFTFIVVNLLLLTHVVLQKTWRDRITQGLRVWIPLLPAIGLTLWSVYLQATEPAGDMTGYVNHERLIPPWELLYNTWAEWFYGFTWLSISSFVPCVLLAILGVYNWRERATFFGSAAALLLVACYCFAPYSATNWFHFNSRFIPFIWFAALLRLPERLDRRLLGLLGLSAVLYSAGMGIDYVRLERDRARFTAGISAVPEGARLLPLVFKSKGTSENTRSLLHAWGFYAMAKHTSVPLLFAHSRSFPVMYRQAPPPRFNHLVLETFAPSMKTPAWGCDVLRHGGVMETDCDGMWHNQWRAFWADATPMFDHVLMWDASPEARAQVPPHYKLVFEQDRLAIYARRGGPITGASTQDAKPFTPAPEPPTEADATFAGK